MTNIMVKANLKIDAGRESNSHSKYAVLNKCARIIADVILKATHANADREGGVARCPYARQVAHYRSPSQFSFYTPNLAQIYTC